MSGNRDSHFQQELIIQRASNMNGFVLLAVSCLLASTVGLTTLACSMPSSKRLNPTPMPPSHAPLHIHQYHPLRWHHAQFSGCNGGIWRVIT